MLTATIQYFTFPIFTNARLPFSLTKDRDLHLPPSQSSPYVHSNSEDAAEALKRGQTRQSKIVCSAFSLESSSKVVGRLEADTNCSEWRSWCIGRYGLARSLLPPRSLSPLPYFATLTFLIGHQSHSTSPLCCSIAVAKLSSRVTAHLELLI